MMPDSTLTMVPESPGTPTGELSRWFRSVAGRFATGVTVAATAADGVPVGMTVNSFTTVSLEPTLLLVCLHHRSRLLAAVRRSEVFALTVLGADQRQCAQWFANPARPAGWAGFAGIPCHLDPVTGCPLLDDGVAYFGCTVEQHHSAGDHEVLIGAVRSWGLLRPGPPLLFADGAYAELATR